MSKLTAWLVTLVGVLLILSSIGVDQFGTPTSGMLGWIIALAVLIIGIGKLFRNYSSKRRK